MIFYLGYFFGLDYCFVVMKNLLTYLFDAYFPTIVQC